MYTSPNGITIQDAGDSVQFTNLGAVAAAAVTIVQSTLAHYFKLSIVAGTTTRLFPPMPVGSELTFEVAIPDAASFLQIQEEDDTGVARALTHRRPTGGWAQFGCATHCVIGPAPQFAAGTMVAANTFSLNAAATGRLEANNNAVGTVLLTYKKIAENTTGTADGWIVTQFRMQSNQVT